MEDKKEKAIKSGWIYSETPHDVIGLHYAVRRTDNGSQVMFEDKTFYNENETAILKNYGVTKTIHNVKSVFNCEIVR